MWIVILIVIAVIAIGAYFVLARRPDATPRLGPDSIAPKLPKPAEKPAARPAAPARVEKPVVAAPAVRPDAARPEAAPAPKPGQIVEERPVVAAIEEQQPEREAEPAEIIPIPEPVAVAPEKPVKPRRPEDIQAVRAGLVKTRSKEGFFGRLVSLISGRKEIDPEIVDQIEEVLLTSDVGVNTTASILNRLKDALKRNELSSSEAVWTALRQEAVRALSVGGGGLKVDHSPLVVLMVGVNGSGKTTTIGKLATHLKMAGHRPILAAGDTFRAAAVQQLEVWGKRVGCDVVKGKDGADPGAVIFDAIQKAIQTGADVVLADTAGRLHTKTPLMDELKKISKTAAKALPGAPHEILLVIDATNGQNAVAQSRQFSEAMPLTGIVLTKLDGTAKGGVILGICEELKVPVRYVGLGERPDDLREFDAEEFVEALLGNGAEDHEAA